MPMSAKKWSLENRQNMKNDKLRWAGKISSNSKLKLCAKKEFFEANA
jgi:hypothetical protein